MDDLEKYIDFLYEGQHGFVYSPIKKPDEWVSEFFAWPAERTKLLDHIRINGSDADIYICPSLFTKKEAKKDSFKSSKVVWVEFDGKEEISFKDVPEPNLIVQTSSDTHVHCYWEIEQINSSESIDEINRRLTYYLQADSSGWDSTQLLRPPTTKNFKRSKQGTVPVLLAHYEKSQAFSLSRFDVAPNVESNILDLQEAQLLNPDKLLKELPLLKSLKTKI